MLTQYMVRSGLAVEYSIPSAATTAATAATAATAGKVQCSWNRNQPTRVLPSFSNRPQMQKTPMIIAV